VTNLAEPERSLYRDFYVKRGEVPEQPIGQLKNGLKADRLSSCGFCANALKLLVALTAYALGVLYREACAAVEEVANADIQTLRSRLWKVPAEVKRETRRVRVSLPSQWEGRAVWEQTFQAVGQYVGQMQQVGQPPGTQQAS
jgi:Transposase DDE domain group 1